MAFTYLYLFGSTPENDRLYILINNLAPKNIDYIVFAKTTSFIRKIIININNILSKNTNAEFVDNENTKYTVCESNISLNKYFSEEQQKILTINNYIENIEHASIKIKNILSFSNSIENIYQKYLFTLIPENIKKLNLDEDQLSEKIKTVLQKHEQKIEDYETNLNKINTKINILMLNIKLKILYKIINKYKKTLEIHHLNAYKILNNINTYIESGGNDKIKTHLNALLNGTLDLSNVDVKEKELIKCIMLFGIATEFSMNDSCKNNHYTVYELRF